jgi:DNA recombination protein RmuC
MTTLVILLAAAALMGAVVAVGLAIPARVAAAVRAALLDRVDGLERGQERLERALRDELAKGRDESGRAAAQLRDEVRNAAKASADSTLNTLAVFGERLDGTRTELFESSAKLRAELAQSVKGLNDSVLRQMTETAQLLRGQLEGFKAQLDRLTDSNEKRLEGLRATVDGRLKSLQDDNAQRLDQMRVTVDEKLHGTLEKRLGESFKLVSDRLEAVQRGLGEMQTLATGVGDLKKVLTNVKVRGTWGEYQLGHLLEQILTPEQYAANVATRKDSAERVEFAIRLPGREEGNEEVLLPIDAKFPVEDYHRLVDASERGDAAAVEEAAKALEVRIKGCARDIRDKYLNPPRTTDFGLLFVPTEGLYAEVVRRPGLMELLQRDYKVSVAGPTTLAALLNSLQMGFRTLAIQRRSSEVWQVLGNVKTEFGKFGVVLEKVEKKLQEAQNQIHDVGVRRRAIERTLKDVQVLPSASNGAQQALLPAVPAEAVEEEV